MERRLGNLGSHRLCQSLLVIFFNCVSRLINKKEINEIIQSDKSVLQTAYTDKINFLKDEMTEKYFSAKQKTLDDYPIFMAIAEDIGYDATGRQTGNNELTEIGKELSKFIQHINKTEK